MPAGHRLQNPGLLFEKIEDEQVDAQVNKLLKTRKTNEAQEMRLPPAKEAVTYDEFARMDIRTATILEAEPVPKTDKLIKLTVDTGIDTRTVVSGIAEHFDPKSLPGKQVVILANLEPRKIRGIESKGMILLAETRDGKLVFVTPDDPIINGSIVK